MPDLGLSWEAAYPLGTALLFGVLLYGFIRYKTRNKANDKITAAATREEYDHPERYANEEDAFREQLKPDAPKGR